MARHRRAMAARGGFVVTALILYSDTRKPYTPREAPFLADADRWATAQAYTLMRHVPHANDDARRDPVGLVATAGQLWDRLREVSS